MTTPKLAQQINSSQVDAMDTLMKACHCLHLEVSDSIAFDITDKARAVKTELDQLKQQLTDLTACLEWASERVESISYRRPYFNQDENWSCIVGRGKAPRYYEAPTLLQALTTAYENRDKTKE